ncbi:hypothetical protein E2986_13377 [Frieseomelitta varia]|uniref:Uncharacterized protein n=1 Tax=Frieseomelitta varia TaxID=561572 RepID=A0A833R6N4_9HYME|nr:hypothetical protein E2986_13377 [Frieseomelitta varia]
MFLFALFLPTYMHMFRYLLYFCLFLFFVFSFNIQLNRESEFNEMAAWLDHTPGAHGDQESLTSSEFERFLAERAAAAEALPTLPTTTTGSTISTGSTTNSENSNIQRQINKDQDKSLFAL